MAKIRILGAGGFGLALAIILHGNGHDVIVWDVDATAIQEINVDKERKTKLPGVKIPEGISATLDETCVIDGEYVLFAVPSKFNRSVAQKVKPLLKKDAIVVNVSKGLEANTYKTMSTILTEELPEHPIVILTGPSHAEELGRGLPTTVTAASKSIDAASAVQSLFAGSCLRVYVNDDMTGCELGGALKNIIALAAGVCDGLGYGDNTKAALMTRGMHEITRLGTEIGGKAETFSGLSGIGDLIVTCCSMHSRNRRAGILIGKGTEPEEAVRQVGTVEGYACCKAAWELARKHNVPMPITECLYGILFGGESAENAVAKLMGRPQRKELG